MPRRTYPLLALPLLLAACHASWPSFNLGKPAGSPWFHTLREGNVQLRDDSLTPFQKAVRARIQRGLPGTGPITEVALLEADLPGDGSPDAGAYMVLYQGQQAALLQYFEQADHTPRNDRLYERLLSPAEAEPFFAFFKQHPLSSLTAPAPASRPASAGIASRLQFRLTRAGTREGRTVQLSDPLPPGSPAAQAILEFSRLRDASQGRWTCHYERQIPLNAQILFADPHHSVTEAWVDGEEIRARIFPPLGTPAADPAEPRWYRLANHAWLEAEPPPAPSAPATAPAEADPRLPRAETWRADPQDGHTNVWHFLPEGRGQGQWKGFLIPGLVFDSSQMHIDAGRGILYALHDRHLIALPIPEAAR